MIVPKTHMSSETCDGTATARPVVGGSADSREWRLQQLSSVENEAAVLSMRD